MRSFILYWLLPALVCSAIVLGMRGGWVRIPPHWNPWQPLDVEAAPNLLTRYKLGRLSEDGAACRAVLATTDMQFDALPDRQTGADCGFRDAVRVRASPSAVGEAFSLSCRAAVSVALWERHAVQPAAMRHFGQRVDRIEHFGSYACRNVYGRPDATRSRHATAEAWDVAGFVLADGRRIRVARDWQPDGSAGMFLHEVRDGACRFFDGVLSPDYNAAHRDHLHLDRGPYRMCR
ncbi:MAG: extensin family protein [Steroidobacteraceae bacterium]